MYEESQALNDLLFLDALISDRLRDLEEEKILAEKTFRFGKTIICDERMEELMELRQKIRNLAETRNKGE